MVPTLRITPDVRNQMFAHAIVGLPNEACGMFSAAANVDLIDQFHPMRNVAESPSIFVLDGQELLDLERATEQAGRELVGVMHSHTATSAYPSPTDVRDSGVFDPLGTYRHVIVSLRGAEPVLRCFTITANSIDEIPVVVTTGSDVHQDEGGAVPVAAVMRLPRSV